MTGGVLLAAYSLAAGFGAPAVLCRDWAGRSPRIAASLWLTLAVSWLAAVPLAALTMAAPLSLTWQSPGGRAAGDLGTAPGGMPAAVTGMLLAAAIVVWASWHLARGLARARRQHRAHAALLAAGGRLDRVLDAVILDDEAPAAYCLPRGSHRVVISAGALSRLSPASCRRCSPTNAPTCAATTT